MSINNCTDFENITAIKEDAILHLTLNRPETRNALDAQMLLEIERAVMHAEQDKDIRVIIISGAGGKSFAAGASIQQLHERSMLEGLVPGMQGIYTKIENCSKVTIAVVDGYALGGGCELAIACDIRIATTNSKFGFPELNLGIMPGAGGTQRLSRMVGKGRALDMILTGKFITGEEAERIGLVSYVVEQEDVDATLQEVTSNILKKGPIVTQLVKQAVHKGYDIDTSAALWIEKLSQTIAFGTEDKNEGTAAFLEKRPAEFKNR